jgi:hypothetical protein
MNFAPCPTCHRHVKLAEPRCPFCGGAVQTVRLRPPSTAALLFGLGLAVGGCSSSSSGTTTPVADAADSQSDVPMMDAAYGPPPDTGAVDTGPVAAYGPPPDTGADAVDAKDTSPAGAYGPPPDTGSAG